MTRLRLVDLFCGEGGCSVGYARAGFDVIGVDHVRHGKYPVGDHGPGRVLGLIVADAMDVLNDAEFMAQFDAVHASPPCQRFSKGTTGTPGRADEHPDLLTPTMAFLRAQERPWVVENVPGSPIPSAAILCGTMFDLTADDTDGRPLVLRRHRFFESSVFIYPPGPCRHRQYTDRGFKTAGVYGGGRQDRSEAEEIRRGGYTPSYAVRRALMGTPWMSAEGVNQAIPPVYAQYLGEQLMEAVDAWADSAHVVSGSAASDRSEAAAG